MKRLWLLLPLLLAALALAGCGEKYIHVGANWQALHELEPPEESFWVKVDGPSAAEKGENLTFSIQTERKGRLWVVQVDPEDRLSLLFPNDESPENAILPDVPLFIPPEHAGWSIQASDPVGKSILAFVVTAGNADLNDVLEGVNGGEGKGLRIVGDAATWGADKLILEIR